MFILFILSENFSSPRLTNPHQYCTILSKRRRTQAALCDENHETFQLTSTSVFEPTIAAFVLQRLARSPQNPGSHTPHPGLFNTRGTPRYSLLHQCLTCRFRPPKRPEKARIFAPPPFFSANALPPSPLCGLRVLRGYSPPLSPCTSLVILRFRSCLIASSPVILSSEGAADAYYPEATKPSRRNTKLEGKS